MTELSTEVTDGVRRIADGAVNYYLVDRDDGVILIDTGWPRSWRRTVRALEEIDRSPADLSAVLLTHGHPDHLGAAEEARKESSASVMAYRGEVPRVKGESSNASPLKMVPSLLPKLYKPTALGFVGEATVKGFLFPTWVSKVEPFDAGPLAGVSEPIEVVPTPGHTSGHVSFNLRDRGVLIAGDALVTRDPLTGDPGPRIPDDSLNESSSQARESLSAIASVEAEVLACGHGEPWRGSMADAVESARSASA